MCRLSYKSGLCACCFVRRMRALCWSYQLNVTLGFVLLVLLDWYDSIVQKRLRQYELWIIELNNFYSEDLFYISLVGQYEIFRAVL